MLDILTPKEECQRSQGSIFAFEPFHQRRQRNGVEDGMEEVEMHERESVQSVA
jgi:hypothetical protein